MADNGLSDEDKALFQQAMHAVQPLSKTNKVVVTPKPLPKKSKPRTIEKYDTISNLDLSNDYASPVQAEDIISYYRPGLSRQRFKQLRAGQIPWESSLDLHGLTVDHARETFCKFIEERLKEGKRCLLIIHGKGSPNGEPPILKNHVNHWLRQLPSVLAFHSALARQGGSGAVYVLLKRL